MPIGVLTDRDIVVEIIAENVSADDLTSDNLLEWMGAGFLATGAATTENAVERAALPFDRRRHGMLMGMGACGLVVESEDAVRERGMWTVKQGRFSNLPVFSPDNFPRIYVQIMDEKRAPV